VSPTFVTLLETQKTRVLNSAKCSLLLFLNRDGVVISALQCERGLTGTTRKQRKPQWKSPSSPLPKKARQVRSSVKCMLTFFTCMELCLTNTNTFPRVKLWTRISVRIFCGIYRKMCGENNLRSGALEMGFFTTTLFPLTLRKRHDCCSAPSLLSRSAPLRHFSFCRTEVDAEDDLMTSWFKNSRRLHLASSKLLQMFSTMAQTLLYQVARELLWCGRHGIADSFNYFREKVVRKFFDYTSVGELGDSNQVSLECK